MIADSAGAAEVRRLQGCLNQLLGVITLSAMWSGRGSAEIVAASLDAMVAMLQLEFAYARLTHPIAGAPAEMLRTAKGADLAPLETLAHALQGNMQHAERGARQRWTHPVTGENVVVAFFPMGLSDDLGTIAVGAARAEFPTQTEGLLLQVAVNQAAMALQEARRLAEQKHAARELESRVAERTAQLTLSNEELRAEIAQRRRAQDEILRLAALVQNSDDFIGLAALSGETLFVNRAGQRLTGITDEELPGILATDFICERERDLVAREIWPTVLRGDRWDGDLCWRNFATGAEIPMHARVFLLREPSTGEAIAVATISTDITQRKRAESETLALKDALAAELAEMTRLHQLGKPSPSRTESQLLEDVLDAMMSLQGADMGSVRLYNPQARRYDLVVQRGFGSEYVERFKSVEADTMPYAKVLARAERVVIEDVERDFMMVGLVEKARSVGVRAVQSIPLFSSRSELVGLISTHFRQPHRPSEHELRFADMYARQAAEMIERRRSAAALQRSEAYLAQGERISHTASWSVNARTGEIFWSLEHYRIFGVEPGNMDPTSEAVAMIHDGDRDATLHDFQRAMREGLPYEGEFRFVRRDGSVRHGHSIGHPVFDEHGELVEMVGTLIDTTDRKLAEEALRKARGELAHVSRVTAMGELTASIAHEVNQPLAAVVANASACVHWLDAAPANLAEARTAAQRIVRDGKRASEVITRIRAFLMRGEPTKQALAIGEVIGDVIGMVQGEARAKGVSLEMEVSGPLRPVMGDRIQLQQVLLNLAVNAIEALVPVTGRDRQVVIGAEEHDAQSLRVYVRDNGPGLDAQELDRIFDTFYTTKPEGMGMGLPISRTIVENHGGRLWAEPNEVCGEIFQFTLPVNGARPR